MPDWSDLHPNLPPHLQDLFDARESEISIFSPLSIPIPRDILIDLVRQDLDRFRARQTETADASINERSYVAAMIQQRLDMLAWLRAESDDPIPMSIFSTREDREEMNALLPDLDGGELPDLSDDATGPDDGPADGEADLPF